MSVFNSGAKKHFLAWPLSNIHEFKSTYQQFITTCSELENVGGYRKALRIYSTAKTVSTYTAWMCTPGRCSWASFKDRLRPLRFSIHSWYRVFCSDGFPYVLTPPFSTPAFSSPPVRFTRRTGGSVHTKLCKCGYHCIFIVCLYVMSRTCSISESLFQPFGFRYTFTNTVGLWFEFLSHTNVKDSFCAWDRSTIPLETSRSWRFQSVYWFYCASLLNSICRLIVKFYCESIKLI